MMAMRAIKLHAVCRTELPLSGNQNFGTSYSETPNPLSVEKVLMSTLYKIAKFLCGPLRGRPKKSFSSDFWVGKIKLISKWQTKAVEFKNAIKIFFKSVSDFTTMMCHAQ